ncbi:blast:Transmembrane protein 256 [Drosophila guanche]|uniref:Blast:Transmembrane protein 256 n=1 Tax=Drosophila guanche TaxID=7266 RepID=A0A3B0JYD9_DROGU|nr:blast:Transmembrane protein 256 [Drosophila guanche]
MASGNLFDNVFIDNPISRALRYTGALVLLKIGLRSKQIIVPQEMVEPVATALMGSTFEQQLRSPFKMFSLAGLSIASTLIMLGVCKHRLNRLTIVAQKSARRYAEWAIQAHFVNSCALTLIPMTTYPVMTITLLMSGSLLFCGSLYSRALTNERRVMVTGSVGGVAIIASWILLVY